MKAVILAGGLGKRLKSEIVDRPKVMALISGKPFLEHQLLLLKRYGFEDLILCVGYKKEAIIDCFGNGSRYGVNIIYSVEDKLLGTGGALKKAQEHLRDAFLVLNGDTYVELDYNKLVKFHKQKGALLTVALVAIDESERYGSVKIGDEGQVLSFSEKQLHQVAGRESIINAGVYVLEPEVLNYIPPNTVASLEKEVIPSLLEKCLSVYGFLTKGYFVDIGTPGSYAQAREHFEAGSGSKC